MLQKKDIERFYQDVDSLGLRFPVSKIAEATEYPKSNVSEYLSRKKEPSEKFIKAFYQAFKSSINVPREKEHLSIVADTGSRDYQQKRREIKNQDKKKGIPFYDAQAQAGISETEMTAIHAPAGTIDIGDLLHDSQAAIRIYGNSMLPNYPPGCVVGLVKCTTSFIEPGEVYVIETKDRRLLKRLFYQSDNPDSETFSCLSDNIMKFEGGARDGKLAYPPFNIPKKDVINLFVVTGVIKRNSNSVIINR